MATVEIVDDKLKLQYQLDINNIQMRTLYSRIRTDKFNLFIYISFGIVCLFGLIVLMLSLVFIGFSNTVNHFLIEYSLSIAVFLAIGLTKAIQLAHKVWIEMDDASLLLKEQDIAIAYANKVLYESSDMK